MKKIFPVIAFTILVACNNKKNKNDSVTSTTTSEQPATNNTSSNTSTSSTQNVKYSVEGKEINASGSILVTKDKDKLQPGTDLFCMLTASGENDQSLTVNFLMDTKPGVYPIVGTSFTRNSGDSAEVYGGILGGQPKLTKYKVTLTECKDLGSNNLGGHKWSISGTFEGFTIPAMGIMLMDKTKNHPQEVKIDGGSFSNLSFDDNWEQIMKEAMEKLQKK